MKLVLQLGNEKRFLVIEDIPQLTLANFREVFIIKEKDSEPSFFISDGLKMHARAQRFVV